MAENETSAPVSSTSDHERRQRNDRVECGNPYGGQGEYLAVEVDAVEQLCVRQDALARLRHGRREEGPHEYPDVREDGVRHATRVDDCDAREHDVEYRHHAERNEQRPCRAEERVLVAGLEVTQRQGTDQPPSRDQLAHPRHGFERPAVTRRGGGPSRVVAPASMPERGYRETGSPCTDHGCANEASQASTVDPMNGRSCWMSSSSSAAIQRRRSAGIVVSTVAVSGRFVMALPQRRSRLGVSVRAS